MSLIDEALKRARQEAAKQDAAARELRYRQVPVIPGLRQPPRRSWLLPVVIAACLIVGIGLGLALSGRGGEDRRAAVPPPPSTPLQPSPQAAETAPAPAAPEVPPSPLPAVVEEAPVPPVAEQKQEARPVPEAAAPPARPVQEEEPVIADMRQREIVLNPPPPPLQAEPTPAPQAPAPEPAAPSAPEPAPAVEPGQVRTYQQELPLAGGGTLRLNGIAYSDRPVALFGDKVVAPGESIAGYKVVAIEQGRVRLEGQGGMVVVEMQ